MSDLRGLKGWFAPFVLLPLPLLAQTAPDPAPVEGADSMPLVMPGYASLMDFHLKAPGGEQPLTQRHIEVITVAGEVDPPFTDGDDRVDLVNPEYNEPRFKELMNADPGMVTATMTVFIEELNPTDNKVQVWEQVIVRVYDADQKDKAAHYCDSTPWKAQPGFFDLTPEHIQFGPWRAIEKHKANSK